MDAKEKRRDAYLRKYFNISLAQYTSLLGRQRGVCYICRRPPSVRFSLAVDHCHLTGVVRGLLCSWCNRGLKFYRDNPEWLRRAARHVNRDPLGARVPQQFLKGRPKKRRRKKK